MNRVISLALCLLLSACAALADDAGRSGSLDFPQDAAVDRSDADAAETSTDAQPAKDADVTVDTDDEDAADASPDVAIIDAVSNEDASDAEDVMPDASVDASSPSTLIVSQVIIPLGPLMGLQQRVMRLHFAASGPRPVAFKRFGFTVEMFSIHRDGLPDAVPSSVGVLVEDARIPDALVHTSLPEPQTMRVSVVFHHERLVEQIGFDADFIVGLNRDTVPGDRMLVTAQIQPGPSFGAARRGALTPSIIPVFGENYYGPHVYNGELPCREFRGPLYPDLGNTSLGYFVWSPMTDPRHSDADCASGGSTDWVNGAMWPPGMFSPSYQTELTP